MSNMKCPFCNQKLEPIGTSGQFQCGTWGCDASFNFYATRDVWEYINRTRKALDVAKYAIKNIQEDMKERKDGDDIWEIQKNLHDYCKTTIKQITALEQKD